MARTGAMAGARRSQPCDGVSGGDGVTQRRRVALTLANNDLIWGYLMRPGAGKSRGPMTTTQVRGRNVASDLGARTKLEGR
jgi:hypothetical protein